jgi:hypothetical protein
MVHDERNVKSIGIKSFDKLKYVEHSRSTEGSARSAHTRKDNPLVGGRLVSALGLILPVEKLGTGPSVQSAEGLCHLFFIVNS